MINTLIGALIGAVIIIFFLILVLISQLNDLSKYEETNKKVKEFMGNNWVSYEDINKSNELYELEIPLQDIKELYEILGEEDGL